MCPQKWGAVGGKQAESSVYMFSSKKTPCTIELHSSSLFAIACLALAWDAILLCAAFGSVVQSLLFVTTDCCMFTLDDACSRRSWLRIRVHSFQAAVSGRLNALQEKHADESKAVLLFLGSAAELTPCS